MSKAQKNKGQHLKNLKKELVLNYPMGPRLREWFSIDDHEYLGRQNPHPTEEQRQNFLECLFLQMEQHRLEDEEALVTIMDELVSMKLPIAVLKIADVHSKLWTQGDFRGLLAEGVSSMLVGELDRAETCFVHAQEMLPLEPAPYVNMIQILLHENRMEECKQWVSSGVKACPNYFGLWELAYEYCSLAYESRGSAVLAFEKLGKDTGSWAFWSCYVDIVFEKDPAKRVEFLRSFYAKGERSSEFLLEYTGALGQAGDFEMIPPIVWEAEKICGTQLPWQLWVHCLQSLSMTDLNTFTKTLDHVKNKLPKEEFENLKAMIS